MESPNENDTFMVEYKGGNEEIKRKRSNSLVRNIQQIIRSISVEPIAILLITPRLICSLTLENLFLQKACYVNLTLNKTTCQALALRDRSGYAPEDEIAVQRMVSQMLPYREASHIIQIFFTLMIGSWSDRTGRRRSMFILPYLGDISAALGYILCVYFFMELSLEYPVFINALFSNCPGGIPMLMVGMYSYVAVTSDSKSRTVRVGIVAIVFRTSMTLGIASSGFIYKLMGFYGVFLTALGLNLIGLVYVFAIIKSFKPSRNAVEEDKKNVCFRLVWDGVRESIVAILRVFHKSGSKKRRNNMILLQALNMVTFGILRAETTVLYMFSRKQFGWDEVDFSIFKCFKTVVELTGCSFVLAYFSKFRKWNDAQIALLACLSRFMATIVMALSKSVIMLYIGAFTDVFNGAILIAVRSMITKTVDQNEQAVANSLTGLFDSLGSFFMCSLYAFVYYHTVAIFPGSLFLVSFFFYIPIFVMLLIMRNMVFETENH